MMTNNRKVLIIEDESVNAQRLQRLLQKIRPDYEVLSVLESIEDSIKWLLTNENPDFVFMDIRLSDGESFEIFNHTNLTCPIIFTTAYDEYAVQAFKYNSIDYLLKPIDQEELEQAVKKFEKLKNNNLQPEAIKNLLSYIEKKEYRTRFLIPYRDSYKQLNVEDIAYFYSELGAPYAMSFNGDKNTVSQSLKNLEEQLNPKHFFRANRQYIIHIDSIINVHNYFNSKLKLDIKQCKDGVVVSRLKATPFKSWLDY